MQDVLSFALWPVLRMEGTRPVLRGQDSQNHYCMFKRIWGRQKLPNLKWYQEALEELGLHELINYTHLQNLNAEFETMIIDFQSTKVRGGHVRPIGIMPLIRMWEKCYVDKDIIPACTSLGPEETLMVETGEPDHQPLLE